jgi:hypothetical protein
MCVISNATTNQTSGIRHLFIDHRSESHRPASSLTRSTNRRHSFVISLKPAPIRRTNDYFINLFTRLNNDTLTSKLFLLFSYFLQQIFIPKRLLQTHTHPRPNGLSSASIFHQKFLKPTRLISTPTRLPLASAQHTESFRR